MTTFSNNKMLKYFFLLFFLIEYVYSFNFTQKIQITNYISNKLVSLEGINYKILKQQKNLIQYIGKNNYLNNNQKEFLIKNIFFLIKKGDDLSRFITYKTYNYILYLFSWLNIILNKNKKIDTLNSINKDV